MDPTSVDLMNQFVPGSNRPDGTFQTVAGIHKDRTDQFTVKFDHRINDKQNFSAYYYFNDSTLYDPYSRFQAGGATTLGFGANTAERYQQYNLTHNWTLSNNLVNEAHFTYFREAQGNFLHPQRTGLVQDSCATVPSDACFNDGTAAQRYRHSSPAWAPAAKACPSWTFRACSPTAITSKAKFRR